MSPIAPDRATVLDSKLKEMGIDRTYCELWATSCKLTCKMSMNLGIKQGHYNIERFLELVILNRHDFWVKDEDELKRLLKWPEKLDPLIDVDKVKPRTRKHKKDYMNRVESPFICMITAVYASSLTVSETAQLLQVSEKTILKRLEFQERFNSLSEVNPLAKKTFNVQKLFGRMLDGEWRIPICQFNSKGRLMRNHKILMDNVDKDSMEDILSFHYMLGCDAPDEVGSLKEWIEHRMTKKLKQFDKVADREQYIYYALNPSAGY